MDLHSGPWFVLGAFRVLRPIRVMRSFESQLPQSIHPSLHHPPLTDLRVLLQLLFDVLPLLGSLALLASVFFLIFSLIGVQLWVGLFHDACHNSLGDVYYPDNQGAVYLCTGLPLIRSCFRANSSLASMTCPPMYGNTSYAVCKPTAASIAFNGAISFDNVFAGTITVFQVPKQFHALTFC